MENYIGKIIDDRYEILSLIGVGGMSNVYRAVDKNSGQEVAIKFLKEETTSERVYNEWAAKNPGL